MLQSGGHDLYEYADNKGFSKRWTPQLCIDFSDSSGCSSLTGCSWANGACTGFPSDVMAQKPANVFGVVQTGDTPKPRYGVKYRYNWVHNTRNVRTSKRGLRFDRSQDICNGRFGDTWPNHMEMSRNVQWDTAGATAKGTNNFISRNTMLKTGGGTHGGKEPQLDDEGFDFSKVYDLSVYDEEKEGTCFCAKQYCIDHADTCCVTGVDSTFEGRGTTVVKNGMERFYGKVGGGGSYPSTAHIDDTYPVAMQPLVSGNSAGVLFEELRDPANLDFRPKAGSIWAQTGVGAYDAADAGTGEYWIPGRQTYRASRPIPDDGATNVSASAWSCGASMCFPADLMFLPGRTRNTYPKAHRVFVSCSKVELEATANAAIYELSFAGDIECFCADDEDPPLPGVAGTAVDEACGAGRRYKCPNIVPVPTALIRPGKKVFWRVDSVMHEGDSLRVVPGQVWSFTFQPFSGPLTKPIGLCGVDHTCISRYYPKPENLNFPLPSEKQSSYVTDTAPISIDEKYSIMKNSSTPLYTIKSVKICLSMNYSAGIGKLGIRLHTSVHDENIQLWVRSSFPPPAPPSLSCVCVRARACVFFFVCLCVFVCVCVCGFVPVHAYVIYVHTYSHTCTHVQHAERERERERERESTYTHVHIRMCAHEQLSQACRSLSGNCPSLSSRCACVRARLCVHE